MNELVLNYGLHHYDGIQFDVNGQIVVTKLQEKNTYSNWIFPVILLVWF